MPTFTLRDLPVRPTITQNLVRETYVEELLKVQSPEELLAFVKRWQPLFFLRRNRRPIDKKMKDAKRYRLTEKYFQQMRALEFSPERVLKCIARNRLPEEHCPHITMYSCEAAHLLVPQVLSDADAIAEKYGVGSDLVLIQQNGGMGVWENLD